MNSFVSHLKTSATVALRATIGHRAMLQSPPTSPGNVGTDLQSTPNGHLLTRPLTTTRDLFTPNQGTFLMTEFRGHF